VGEQEVVPSKLHVPVPCALCLVLNKDLREVTQLPGLTFPKILTTSRSLAGVSELDKGP
jgi:hypothetical protein